MNRCFRLALINLTLAIGIFVTGVFVSPHEEPPQTFFSVIGVFTALATFFAVVGFIVDGD